MITKKCENCDNLVKGRWPCEIKQKRFCSSKCATSSPQVRERIRKIAIENSHGKWMEGRIPAFILQGKKFNHPSGVNHPNYKDGKYPKEHSIRKSKNYKIWRENVFKRDEYACAICKCSDKKLSAHHIKDFVIFHELRFEVSNGLTVCNSCHAKIHHPKGIKFGNI